MTVQKLLRERINDASVGGTVCMVGSVCMPRDEAEALLAALEQPTAPIAVPAPSLTLELARARVVVEVTVPDDRVHVPLGGDVRESARVRLEIEGSSGDLGQLVARACREAVAAVRFAGGRA